MSYFTDVIYRYDGTFEGLLCCVFESYEKKEIPTEIIGPDKGQESLFVIKQIKTEPEKARRVAVAVPTKISQEAFDFIRYAFLTCFNEKELTILLFLRKGFRVGSKVMFMLTDHVVDKLTKAVKHLLNESHLLKGFIRFSDFHDVLVAEIAPKNYVLPLLAKHFSERYPQERFVIYDKTHQMALVYDSYQTIIGPIEKMELPKVDEKEATYRKLWKTFYDTIEIKERHNPKCRMNLMPKRYWRYMTEFNEVSAEQITKLIESKQKKLLR